MRTHIYMYPKQQYQHHKLIWWWQSNLNSCFSAMMAWLSNLLIYENNFDPFDHCMYVIRTTKLCIFINLSNCCFILDSYRNARTNFFKKLGSLIHFQNYLVELKRGCLIYKCINVNPGEYSTLELLFQYQIQEPFLKLVQLPYWIKNVYGCHFLEQCTAVTLNQQYIRLSFLSKVQLPYWINNA